MRFTAAAELAGFFGGGVGDGFDGLVSVGVVWR